MEENKMKDMVITIAGGGSTYTPGVVKALLTKKKFNIKEIRMYDVDEERQNSIAIIVKRVIQEMDRSIELLTTVDPQTAFQNADFIFSQIRVGKYEMREYDEKIPLAYGAVGQETCGCGGLAYGLRTIYPMVEIVDYADTYANADHWILNYSNPAAIVAEALNRLRPHARIINICDMPVAIIDAMAIILDVEPTAIVPNYFGLNHFGWFTNVFVDGIDRIEELRSHVKIKGYLTGIVDEQHYDPSWYTTYENAKNMVELFPDYLPNTYLQYYLLSDEVVAHSNKTYTRANEVQNGREKKLFSAIDDIKTSRTLSHEAFTVGVHGTFIIDVANALCSEHTPSRFLLIVENKGAITNIQDDAMVEIPCYISKRGIERIAVGNIPTFHKGLIEQQLASEKLIVDAAIQNSYQRALEAFTMNKTICSATQAKKILDEMMIHNQGYWPNLS